MKPLPSCPSRLLPLCKSRYLYKAFRENKLDTAKCISNIKNILEFYGQGNLIKNIFKITEVEISGSDHYKPKRKFFQKRASDCFLKRTSYSFTGNKSFINGLKELYEKENYLRLKNFETRRAILRPRPSLYKGSTVTGKWYNAEKQKQIWKLSLGNSV